MGNLSITNYGLINGAVSAISSSAGALSDIDNYGEIAGELALGPGEERHCQQLRPDAGEIIFLAGYDFVFNAASATMGDVNFTAFGPAGGQDTLNNKGRLGSVEFGSGDDVFTNYGPSNMA